MLTFHDDEAKAAIEADTGLRPPFALEAFPDAEQDVRQSIARIKASPFIPHTDQVRQARGFVDDVATHCKQRVRDNGSHHQGEVSKVPGVT
jgi:carbonic anhydrase